ncbi:PhzF family phenazine biosynthesis protein [Negadavirga shengliensis]|uniref:PhzF family phenazine biosynthesis protein n=1 Tax=Negadavirga shengliensis TaxID=1389218 RepID=A0ABV9T7G2_9BACT
MELPIVTVDAFTDEPFGGNPAGICLLPGELSDEGMQLIAAELNLSETSFLEKIADQEYSLRWFTPEREVDLCGHATLASAFLLYTEELADTEKDLIFHTRSGKLIGSLEGEEVKLDFPLIPTESGTHPYFSNDFFGQKVISGARLARNWILELEHHRAVEYVQPDYNILSLHSEEGIIITSEGDGEYDFWSRYFAPNLGIREDPVTGFAHCALVDFWHKKTDRHSFNAYQASKRGGNMRLQKMGDRVFIFGKAVKMFEGMLNINI